MKKIFTILIAVLLTASVFAQAPQKMSYQAVIRDASDNLVISQAVGIQISILQGTASGTVVYVETQTPTTNANGLVSIEIGTGTVVSGDFTTIDWANGSYFIKTETDPTGGTNYTITGTSQLLSVPYALHAKTAETVSGGITEADPVYTGSQAANITATDITNLGNLSGTNTGDQDLSTLATKTALGDSTAQVRSEIPDVSGFLTSETDPTYTSSEAANITATDITNLGNLSGTNTGDQDLSTLATKTALGDSTAQVRSEIPAPADGSETKVTAGTNVTVTGSGTTASPYVVNATGGATLAIGDSYQGGIIFWLDATGQHGLIAATTDQSTGIQWYNGTYTTTNAVRDGIGAGMYNTERIIANQSTGSYAAQLCANYQGGGYGDWYLPSKYELNLLYNQKDAVGGFASAYYWSSTEGSNDNAWLQYFGTGSQSNVGKLNTNYVRAIRAF